MADLTNAERETHISMCADNRSMWAIGTDDAYWQRRFEAVGATLTKVRGEWREYTLPANQISLRNPPKPMSEERKAELAMQLRSRAAAPVITDAKTANMAFDGEGVEE